MKTNFVKAALALTLIGATASATPHQFSTVELLTSGNVPDQKVSVAKPETNKNAANLTAKEYVISTLTQPSIDEACTSDDVFIVKLILLDDINGELRMYDADANLLGNEKVTIGEQKRDAVRKDLTNRKPILGHGVMKVVDPIDLEHKRILTGGGVSKIVDPYEDEIRHAVDPIMTNAPERVSGTDRVSICFARNQQFIIARQLQANLTCRDLVIKISCPDLDVFTSIVLKARCVAHGWSVDKNIITD